jgi:hypothetical protein
MAVVTQANILEKDPVMSNCGAFDIQTMQTSVIHLLHKQVALNICKTNYSPIGVITLFRPISGYCVIGEMFTMLY